MADGQVVFEITADGKKAIASIKDITKAIESEGKKWDDAADDAAGGAEDAWSKAVAGIVGKLTAAGVAAIFMKWGKAAIEAASDLQEVQNVVDVTFGDSANQIESWAKKAGKQYGLTETAAKKYTSTIGAMLKSQGMADDEIVQTSTDLAGLTADMASFYNLDFETAFQKIRSGISGETEPLKQLGINMSAANLEAFRLEKGITKAYSAMSQSEQTMLRYQYLMQATSDAQGDFARTSDGYANAARRVATAMETIKTKAGEVLLPFIADATTQIAGLLESLTSGEITTAMTDFTSIDEKTGQKVSNIQKTAQDANDLTSVLEKLSKETSLTDEQQAQWLETCKRLVQTIPGLSSIINTETGEVKGGTQAVYDYVKAWEEGQTKLAMLGAIQQKEDAISQRFSDLPSLQLDMALAEKRVRDQKKKMDELKAKYGFENGYYDLFLGTSDVMSPAMEEWDNAVFSLRSLEKAAKESTDTYNLQVEALEEAKTALEEYKEIVEEMPGDTEAAEKALKDWQKAAKEVGPALLDSAKQALEALADYVQGVHDATESAVNGVVKGFDKLVRPTSELEERRSNLIEQQNALNTSTDEGKRKYEEYQKQIDELNKSIREYQTGGMQDALQSQLAFMDEYISNLEKAQRMGLSGDLLSFLSDGSVQSAEYLAQLVANPTEAAKVDALYQQVQAKKEKFTDTLTEQKLTADETYQSMVEKAQETIEELDLGQEASDAMKSTVEGLAQGLAEGVPELSNAVTAVIEQLNRLSGYGVSVSLPNFGSFATGYSATTPSINYDGLGSVISGSAGGNVYLDGRQVGRVISEQQGNSYRAVERSGWRAP